ncbi:hypothetical protein F1C58_16185 (plasmid) [Glaciihabitans sp. INWT7]|uniref:hypothetical protein n=1 Tax=Glaciihabitans sp. INWT7 TaxID=2596912 RepID=UPI00186295E6|nr:hypothetical protein [Glaciihabitans sp. INWT7]QNE48598.1 hypothetical protein F1C58_16185 [Glaciihabitans sp. INWT7]
MANLSCRYVGCDRGHFAAAHDLGMEHLNEVGTPAQLLVAVLGDYETDRCQALVREPGSAPARCILKRHGGIFQHSLQPLDTARTRRARDADVWDAAADCLADDTQRSVLKGLNPHRDAVATCL